MAAAALRDPIAPRELVDAARLSCRHARAPGVETCSTAESELSTGSTRYAFFVTTAARIDGEIRPRRILPVLVVSQLLGTSLWFAGNAVAGDLQQALGLPAGAVGSLVSSVQLGFIVGTLFFAVFSLADRVVPPLLFCGCCLCGALANAGILLADDLPAVLASRAATGFFLAGVYPVGMKIAASWFEEGLGGALGLLVGALVLGTASPHLIRAAGVSLPWETVVVAVSVLAATGGVLLALAVPEGPTLRARARFEWSNTLRVFLSADFRAAAFGYFGHMWELYAFWTFVPALFAARLAAGMPSVAPSLGAFVVIGAGSVGCVIGGLLVPRFGSARVATAQLAVSGLLVLASPWLLGLPLGLFLAFVALWGVTVVGDSPQFSTLNAQSAPRELVGTALTVVTCVGFALTIPAIELLGWLLEVAGPRWAFCALAPGPMVGLLAMRRWLR